MAVLAWNMADPSWTWPVLLELLEQPRLEGHYIAQGVLVFVGGLLFVIVAVACYKGRNSRPQVSSVMSPGLIGHQPLVQETEEQQQRRQLIQANGGLGVRGMVAASRNPRRYHSIAILTDSTSLLMETGDDFFAPPQARRGLRKHSGNGSRLHRHRQNNEPSGADDASRLLQGGGRFATTNGVFAGGNNGEGVRRADGGGGGGRRVFTLPSLASTSKANIGNHSFISSTHAKDYSASTNAPASSLASTACGSG